MICVSRTASSFREEMSSKRQTLETCYLRNIRIIVGFEVFTAVVLKSREGYNSTDYTASYPRRRYSSSGLFFFFLVLFFLSLFLLQCSFLYLRPFFLLLPLSFSHHIPFYFPSVFLHFSIFPFPSLCISPFVLFSILPSLSLFIILLSFSLPVILSF
jgi:hypothetical protein